MTSATFRIYFQQLKEAVRSLLSKQTVENTGSANEDYYIHETPDGALTPEGMQVVASASGKGARTPLPKSTNETKVLDSSAAVLQYQCGHSGPSTFRLSLYGLDSGVFKGQTEHCPECLISIIKNEVTRCARCGLPIFIGEGVALYHTSSPGLRLDIATLVEGSALGCMRWECCPSGAFLEGPGLKMDLNHSSKGRR